MTERMIRMDMIELPKMLPLDQGILRELRTESPESFESGLIQPASSKRKVSLCQSITFYLEI